MEASLLQFGVAGLLAVFVIYSAREMRAFVENRDKEWREFAVGRDKQWQELLTDLTERVEYLANKVAKNTAILVLLYRDKSDDSAAKQLIEEFLDECTNGESDIKNFNQ